ncbi:ABC-three component system middle component 6 [Hymenobacter sp.]|uniref:ABC-three component system middle component 6 n=1 Tax=Hymenobacter sp. TaxID=1898978 RepID=UPI0039C8843C
MITPHKLLDLDYSLLNVAGMIIHALKNSHALAYDELFNIVTHDGQLERAKYVFPLSLGFLYLVERLEYNKEGDLIELTNHEA